MSVAIKQKVLFELVPRRLAARLVMVLFAILALFPIVLILINSFKSRSAIFNNPLALPTAETFSLQGFITVFARSNFPRYFVNSLVVTLVSIGCIILMGAMAAWALSEYRFRGNRWLGLYLALGIMIPIRLGTVSLLRMFVSIGLVDNLLALILVYVAQGLPLTIFILQQFISQIPRSLKEAGRLDGASEYRVFGLILPMIHPVLATVSIFTMVPIWNDLWFPLIFTTSDSTRTIILGAQQFLGQFVSDWNAVLASLSLAMIPAVVIYIIFSRHLVNGLTAGAVKE